MTQFLVKRFIKDYTATSKAKVRHQYGLLGGTVGIICNLFLFVFKLLIGFLSGSISIIADAINNLSDAGSSIITIVGFKISSKPADEDHPFGHARVEYISGLIISFIILFLGLQLISTSIEKILNPEAIFIQGSTFVILITSIIVKLWLYGFNKHLGKNIESTSLLATAKDSLNDAVTTSGILISIIITYFTGFNLDGYIGVIVALFIIYSGVEIIKDTISPLLGEAPSEELVKTIQTKIMSYPNVLGFHDLMVHSYGPNRCFSSVHVEVDANQDILISHDLIDDIERDFMLDLNIHMVIHLDPIITDDAYTNTLKSFVEEIIHKIDPILSIHDFRAVQGASHTNLIYDVTVPPKFFLNNRELAERIDHDIRQVSPQFHSVITIDTSYVSTRINTLKG